jgi:hypothetical protein
MEVVEIARGSTPGSCKEKSCRVIAVSICRELQCREAGIGGTHGKMLKSVRGPYLFRWVR